MADFSSWANLGAVSVVTCLLVWLITKGVPGALEKFERYLKEEREAFRDDTKKQREDFRQELKEQRDQSKVLAESGHDAVRNLARQFENLSGKLELLAKNGHDKG